LSRRPRVWISASFPLVLASLACAQCPLGLTNLGQPVGLTDAPVATLVHDFDGPGPLSPELFVATRSNLNAWNGTSWRPFGAGLTSSAQVRLASHDFDGSGPDAPRIVAANTNPIAIFAYDASGASLGIPGGFNNQILSMLSFDQDGPGPAAAQLIAAGRFTTITIPGSPTRNRIASWNGTTWNALGAGLSSDVQTLELWDTDGDGPLPAVLVAGGRFTGPGLGQFGVATWNGTAWTYLAFPSGASVNEVRDFTTWDHDGVPSTPRRLVAVGSFTLSIASGFRNIAMWTGTTWTNIGTPNPLSAVDSVTTAASPALAAPERLVIAGGFSIVAPLTSITGVAVFENNTWQPLGSGLASQSNMSVVIDATTPANRITVLGPFTTTPAGTPVNYAAQWTGSAWRSMPDTADANLAFPVRFAFDLVTPADERVLVAITDTGSLSRLYRRGSAGWQFIAELPTVTSAVKWTLPGAARPQIALAAANNIITTDGLSTTTLATIANATDIRLAVRKTLEGSRLIAAGNQRVYTLTPSGTLQQLGGVFNALGTSLTAWDHDANPATPEHILAAGGFTTIGGQLFPRVARWNDSAWINIGGIEVNQPVNVNMADLITTWNHDNNPATPNVPVCLGAFQFANASNTEVRGLTQWTGSQWAPMPAGRPWTIGGPALLDAWDRDGVGPLAPELVTASGGQAWSLSSQGAWQPLGSDTASLFAVVGIVSDPARPNQPDALFVSRRWNSQAEAASPAAALFVGACRECDPIDFNNNQVFPEDQDVIDFFAAITSEPCATCSDIDFNNNQVFPEDQDVLDFLNVLAGDACS
ncbi:MAG: hypothetical protein ACK46I_10465, partial [Phycisphaerae bacterium]